MICDDDFNNYGCILLKLYPTRPQTECEHIIGPTDAVLTGIRAKLFK